MHITYTEGMKRTFQEKLLQNGRDVVVRSRRTLEKHLQEHIVKLERIRKEGGHTISIEREIRNFKSQIQAIDAILK